MFEIITLITLILVVVFFIFKTVQFYIVQNYFRMVINILITLGLTIVLLYLIF